MRFVVKPRRMFQVIGRRCLAEKGNTDGILGCGRCPSDRQASPDQSPDLVLRLAEIVRTKLARHWDGHLHESSAFDRPFEIETRSKCRNVAEARDLVPRNRFVDS